MKYTDTNRVRAAKFPGCANAYPAGQPGSLADDGINYRQFLARATSRADNTTSGNVMKLSPGQLKEFDEQGYLFFPNCFSEEEIALLRDDAERSDQRNGLEPIWALRPALFCVTRQAQPKLQPEKARRRKGLRAPDENIPIQTGFGQRSSRSAPRPIRPANLDRSPTMG